MMYVLLADTVSPATFAGQVEMFPEPSASHDIIYLDSYIKDVFICWVHLKRCNAVKTEFLKTSFCCHKTSHY